ICADFFGKDTQLHQVNIVYMSTCDTTVGRETAAHNHTRCSGPRDKGELRAKQRAPANVTCIHADVLNLSLPAEHYDAIVSITALHHVPLGDALRHLAPALRPGGVLAAVVLPRSDLPRDTPTEIVGAAANRAFGGLFAALRAIGCGGWYGLDPTHAAMPKVVDPPLTTRQAREVAAATLPCCRVRRLLFWRYLLVWRRPV